MAEARSHFLQNPHNFVKKLQGNPKGGQQATEIEDVEQHLADAHNYEDWHIYLNEYNALMSKRKPTMQLKTNEMGIKLFYETI